MTTSNTIRVNSVDNAMYVPLETIHTQDSLNYVFRRQGLDVIMQQVVLGLMNENNVIIHEGVSMDDQLYLSTPSDTAGIQKKLLAEDVWEKYQQQKLVPDPMGKSEKEMSGDISEHRERRN
ncbi:MAG: hypothetical protein U5J63_18075 [Fodinibius sp.]|nr:hypothetical protein [Fodinibius sp.]